MPKDKKSGKGAKHPGSLEVQLKEDMPGMDTLAKEALKRKKRREEQRGQRQFAGAGSGLAAHEDDDAVYEEASDDGAGVDNDFLSSKMSRRVMDEARAQLEEDAADPSFTGAASNMKKKKVRFGGGSSSSAAAAPVTSSAAYGSSSIAAAVSNKPKRKSADSDESDDEDAEDDDDVVDFGEHDDVALEGDYVDARMEGLDASQLASEEAIMRRFMPDAAGERRTLADIIMEKLKDKEEGAGGEGGAGGAAAAAAAGGMDPKVVEVYTEVGRYLSKYKSGKLPKVFKIIPGLSNWEEVLFLTNPETWTPHSTYAATRIFASNFNAAKAQRFLNLILLPKCRDDIYYHKRLNFHLYLALKKATYKPSAFYKGIVLPLAAAGDCTLKEALIFGSVVSKMTLPQIHSAAALIKLAGMEYNGAVSVLLRTLINKKYTLPYLAVDALVDHFSAFKAVPGPLPLIWHQALLAFAQRYKGDLTAEQKTGMRELMGTHQHHAITPEVRRELFSAGCRGDAPSMAPPTPSALPTAAAGAASSATAPAAALLFAPSTASATAAGPAAVIFAGASAAAGRSKSGKSGKAGAKGGMEVDF